MDVHLHQHHGFSLSLIHLLNSYDEGLPWARHGSAWAQLQASSVWVSWVKAPCVVWSRASKAMLGHSLSRENFLETSSSWVVSPFLVGLLGLSGMCVCAGVCMSMQIFLSMHVCTGQRSASGVISQGPPTFTLIYFWLHFILVFSVHFCVHMCHGTHMKVRNKLLE